MELKKKPIPDDPMHLERSPNKNGRLDTVDSDLPPRAFKSNHKLTDGTPVE